MTTKISFNSAATNLIRPAGAPACRGNAIQSDWSQSYEALLCHRFGASCSTVAVGGKCVMRECGGLQMPDYYQSALVSDAPNATYDFGHTSGWVPDVVFIDLGTNDERAIHALKTSHPNGTQLFINQTVAFMHSIVQRYGYLYPRPR